MEMKESHSNTEPVLGLLVLLASPVPILLGLYDMYMASLGYTRSHWGFLLEPWQVWLQGMFGVVMGFFLIRLGWKGLNTGSSSLDQKSVDSQTSLLAEKRKKKALNDCQNWISARNGTVAKIDCKFDNSNDLTCIVKWLDADGVAYTMTHKSKTLWAVGQFDNIIDEKRQNQPLDATR